MNTPLKWYAYGHDFGNAEIGGVVAYKDQILSRSIPTAFAKVDTSAMKSLGVEMENAYVIRMYGEETAYAVGELALQQAIEAYNGRGDMQRYASHFSLRGLLTVASLLIPDSVFGLYVVAGLPAETYIKNVTLRSEIKAALDGTHLFNFNGQMRSVTVEVAVVVMEGAGALIAYGERKGGKTMESAVVDLGGRTTDLYVARGQVPVTDFCKGKPLGVETATQLLIDLCERKYDRTLSLLEAREIMHSFASNGQSAFPDISVYGHSIAGENLERLASEAVTQIGSEIVSFVSSAWRQNDRGAVAASFRPVLCIGGGVYYFYAAMKKRIPHLSRPEDPIHANALGYCTLASRLLQRKVATTVVVNGVSVNGLSRV
ncbi:MAG: ParM/StbA family protein [Chloroflexi bacterium]|nr:ParM/StbA family protein [Ktedonobacteraceae bacterium]MBV8822919.1 ParM/StbA family protein [Ktedonobacteraceae bacterium]MBV9019242.1 ParM/StbA family protein [Ktedonobacteraceae bacterium]MBV9705794.1 ParM/StbA family protein [Chloroflexota bacterium]